MTKFIGTVLILLAAAFVGYQVTKSLNAGSGRIAPKQDIGRSVNFQKSLVNEAVDYNTLFRGFANESVSTRLNFADWTKNSQIDFRHTATRTSDKFLPEIMGSGVIMADFNRDGAPDLIFINGGDVKAVPNRPSSMPNRMYLNDGTGRFREVTEEWQLPSFAYGMGGAAADFDNNGWDDLLLTSWGGGTRLYRNVHGQRFEEVTESSRIPQDLLWSTSCGFFDYNRDGFLDIYIVHYIDYTLENAIKCMFNEYHVYCAPLLYKGVADRLLKNNGDGTFTDVTFDAFPAESLLRAEQGEPQDLQACKGLAVGLGDLNNDGWMDIYCANDVSRNFLFINQGDGKFKEIGRQANVAFGENGLEQSGMGVAFSDVDRNGHWDILCTNFQGETTNLYSQDSRLRFLDRCDELGIGKTSRARLSFGCDFFDADNNGLDDLLIANGHIFDNVHEFSSNVAFAQPNSLYEALGGGKYRDVSAAAGEALADKQVSRGLAIGDLDHDGRLDFVISNNDGPAQIARNETSECGNFLSIWLEGRRGNVNAIGAKLVAKIAGQTIEKQVFGATSYLSQSDRRVHFGLGPHDNIEELKIYWPGEAEPQVLQNLKSNQFLYVIQGSDPRPYEPGRGVIPYESAN